MKKHELIELLKRSHAALEAVTNRHGCGMKTAMTLVDCENALNELAKVRTMPSGARGVSLVH